MQVVLLAAGQGTRLRPLTHDRPKSMVNVAGQPLLHHLLRDLQSLGVKEAILVVGHGHARLRSFLGDGFRYGLKITYVQQDRQLGSGHALKQAEPHLHDDEFLVLPADAWYHRDVVHRLMEATGPTLMQVEGARSTRHGIPMLEHGKAVDLLDGPEAAGGLAGGGAYRMPRRVLAAIDSGAYRLRDAIRRDLRAHGPWNAVLAHAHEYLDVIEVEDLLQLNARLLAGLEPRIEGTVDPGAHVSGPVRIGEGSRIRAGTVITGPAVIGRHCDIGPNAVLNPGTSVRNHVRVGAFAYLQDCSLGSNVNVETQARIRRAFLDTGAKVGPGARIDGGPGAAVGADALLEADSAVREGGRIGRLARVSAGRAVRDVPDGGVAV